MYVVGVKRRGVNVFGIPKRHTPTTISHARTSCGHTSSLFHQVWTSWSRALIRSTRDRASPSMRQNNVRERSLLGSDTYLACTCGHCARAAGRRCRHASMEAPHRADSSCRLIVPTHRADTVIVPPHRADTGCRGIGGLRSSEGGGGARAVRAPLRCR